MRCIFMCRSLTYAQSAARALEKNAVTATIRKAPAGLGSSGCSYCVSVSQSKAALAARVLRSAGLLQGRIYFQQDDVSYSEVFL